MKKIQVTAYILENEYRALNKLTVRLSKQLGIKLSLSATVSAVLARGLRAYAEEDKLREEGIVE